MNNSRPKRNIFPAALLTEGRTCLIAGGGKIAARKADLLLDAGTVLTVVSPALHESLAIKAAAGQIRHLPKPFDPDDVEGMFLVFAATDNRLVNRQVMDACRRRNILCCTVDGNWMNGDFVTPAILRDDEFILTISTGGNSCRRSRRLKENIRHHVRFLQNADLLVIGIDHNRADAADLEAAKRRIQETGELFTGLWGVHEYAILSTCNRVELIGIVSDHRQTLQTIRVLMQLPETGYIKQGEEAFIHLAQLAAGLLSQTPGESNIVAQLKEAFATAEAGGRAGGGMQSWLDSTLRISKEIRQEFASQPGFGGMEVEHTCDRYIRLHGPMDPDILILGRGTTGSGMLRLRPEARQISGRDPAEIESHLPCADVVIATTGSETCLLTEKHRPLLKPGALLIDLSMPRNIDPALPGTAGLADLKKMAQPDCLQEMLEYSRSIIKNHLDDFNRLVTNG